MTAKIERISGFINKFATLIVIIFLIITGLFACQLSNISIKTELTEFMPEHEVSRAMSIAETDFSSSKMLLILAKSDNILSRENLRELLKIENLIRDNPAVFDNLTDRKIFGIADAVTTALSRQNITLDDVNPDQLASITKNVLTSEVQLQAMLSNDLDIVSNTASSTFIILFIDGHLSKSEQKDTAARVSDIISAEKEKSSIIEYGVFSDLLVDKEVDAATTSSFSLLALICFILIILTLYSTFKKILDVIITLLGLGIALVWTFGIAAILDLGFNMITVFTTMLIIGVGVDFAIHVIHRYRNEELRDNRNSLATVLKYTGTPILLATITTVFAFLTNMISPIGPIRNFGIILSIGIISCFLIFLMLLPSILILAKRVKRLKNKVANNSTNKTKNKLSTLKIVGKISRQITQKSTLSILAILIISTVMVYGVINVKSEFSMIDFMPDNIPVKKTLNYFLNNFSSGATDQTVILIEGDITNPELLQAVSHSIKNMNDTPLITKVGNFSTVESVISLIDNNIKTDSTLSNLVSQADTNDDGIPDDNLVEIYDYLFSTFPDAKKFIHKEGPDYDMMLIQMLTNTQDASNVQINELVNELNKDIEPIQNLAKTTITGMPAVKYVVSSSLQKGMINSAIIAIITCLIFLIILFKSFKYGLIAITPIMVAGLWVIGSMYFMSTSLNMLTAMIFAFTIGIGVDYAIHVICRYKEEINKIGNNSKAMEKTISNTSPVLLGAAITTIIGVGILAFSSIPPLSTFGIFAALSVILSLILTIIIVPILLNLTNGKKRN